MTSIEDIRKQAQRREERIVEAERQGVSPATAIDVADADDNTTRFVILANEALDPAAVQGGTAMTTFVFEVKNILEPSAESHACAVAGAAGYGSEFVPTYIATARGPCASTIALTRSAISSVVAKTCSACSSSSR